MSTGTPPSKEFPATTAAERAEASSMRTGAGGAATSIPGDLPRRTVIHENARQKYVLVSAESKQGAPIYFVRGDRLATYHKDAAKPLVQELFKLSIKYEVLGGGRIEHSKEGRSIKVYGYSYGFPWKDGESRHYITAAMLEEEFPGFSVTYTDEGY